jgi:hypothetical protein
MSAFFGSIASDLRDRRFLPILIVLGVALVAALAYAVLGGGSSSSSTPAPTASSPGPAGKVGAIAIVKAPETSASQAVAETTSGSPRHGSGAPRNPFKPLSSPKTSPASTASSASSTGPSSSSGSPTSGSTSSGSGSASSGSEPAPSKPSAPAKPKYYVHFHTTVQFGLVPASPEGAPAQPAQLKTYPNMVLNEPLPSKTEPQLVYLGVTVKTGKDAAFGLTGEAILKGGAVCRPSPSQCEAIELQAGQSETLEVIDATGQAKTYELKLVSIEKTVSASASAARVTAKAAAAVDRNGALRASGLRFSPGRGGLVFIGRRAFVAHAARHR